MNKQYLLTIVLLLAFSCSIFSQIKTKSTKEKAKTEHKLPDKNVKQINRIPKDTTDNIKILDTKTLQTPGVYVQNTPNSIPTVIPVETAIPVFIGYTEKGFSSPTRISSMAEYKTKFGGGSNEDIGEFQIDSDGNISSPNILTTPKYKMYYMLELFFANGGSDCFIISVDHYNNKNTIRNQDMLKGLTLLNNEDSPKLIIFPDATSSKNNGKPVELYKAALAQCAERKDCFLICDVEVANDDITESAEKFRFSIGSGNLQFGAAYFPPLRTTLHYNFSEDKIQVKLNNKTLVLRHTDATISHDPNKAETSLYHVTNENNRAQYQEIKQIISAIQLDLPPSAAVAGVYVKTDALRGVWKAPSNVSLNKVNAPTLEIDETAQTTLNIDQSGKSINAIRSFKGKGIMVWGARTMAGDDNDWKYIPVTRLSMTIEASVKKALKQFENSPNNPNTWISVKTMTQNYLNNLWRSGALNGNKPKEAYYVKVGLAETMTEQDINQGKLIVEIGIAASRPAEFSVLRISQNIQQN